MALSVGELEATLKLKSSMDADLAKVNQQLSGFSSSVKQIGGVIAAAFTAQKIVQFGMEAVKSYSEQEDALVRLGAALKAQGTYTPTLLTQYDGLSKQFQQTTIYADELTAEMMALLTQVGNVMPDQMEGALKAATNLASGLGIDLRTATMLVGKAFAGETGTLKRYGIVIDEASLKSGGATAVLKALNDQFGGQAQAQAATYSGQVAQLTNTWDDFKEAAGKVLVDVFKPLLPLLKDTATWMQGVGKVVEYARTMFDALLYAGLSAVKMFVDAKLKVMEVTNVFGINNKEIARLKEMSVQLAGSIQGVVVKQDEVKVATETSTGAVRQRIVVDKEATEAAKKAAEAYKAFVQSAADNRWPQLASTLGLVIPKLDNITGSLQEYNDANLELLPPLEQLIGETDLFGHALSTNVIPSLRDVVPATETATNKFKEFQDVLKRIPDTVKQAFMSGGGLLGALKAISVELSESLLKTLSAVQAKVVGLGSTAAAALGSKVSGGMGATVAGIASGLGGAALAASAWGTSMAAAGVAGSIALGAATLGIGAAAVGVVALIKHWKNHQKEVEANTKAVGEFEKSMWSTLTASQAQEAAGRGWAATVIAVRDAYLATGRSVEDAMRDVESLWQSTTKGAGASQAAIDLVNKAFIELANQKEAMRTLDEVTKKYGFTLEELGPALQRQELDKKAQELFKDYQILTAAGIDHTKILERMSQGINEYVKNALAMGLEVPEAMRPMLEEMIKQGLLTDASGKKITDLKDAGINFAMTMSEGFKALIESVEKLADAISRGLGLAVKDIPHPPAPWEGWPPPPNVPDYGDSGGRPPDNGGAYEGATGGLVTPRGIAKYLAAGSPFASGPRGTDTVPAWLTPGERVLSVKQNQAFERGGLGGNTAAMERKLTGIENELRWQRRTIPSAIRDALQRNRTA